MQGMEGIVSIHQHLIGVSKNRFDLFYVLPSIELRWQKALVPSLLFVCAFVIANCFHKRQHPLYIYLLLYCVKGQGIKRYIFLSLKGFLNWNVPFISVCHQRDARWLSIVIVIIADFLFYIHCLISSPFVLQRLPAECSISFYIIYYLLFPYPQ